jgi:hypothetical protein
LKWQPGRISSLRDQLERGGALGVLIALRSPRVQSELGLDSEQVAKVRQLEYQFDSGIRKLLVEGMENTKDLEKRQALNGRRAALLRDRSEALKSLIGRAKFRRLCEVALQVEGPLAVTWPEIRELLNVDDGQNEMLVNIKNEFDKVISDIDNNMLKSMRLPGGPSGPARGLNGDALARATRDHLKEVTPRLDMLYEQKERARARAEGQVARVLTRRQRATLDKLKGKPVEWVGEMRRPGSGSPRPEDPKKPREKADHD